MANKKNIRSDKTYIISTDKTDNPKLGAKILTDGRESLFLDYYNGYTVCFSEKLNKEVIKKDRKREFLKLYLWQAPRTPSEREQNRATLELAKRIRFERGQRILESVKGYRLNRDNKNLNYLDYYQNYIDKYTKKDIRVIKSSFQRFKDFLSDTPKYKKFETLIKPEQITTEMIKAFTEYLQMRSKGGGAKAIYNSYKKVIKSAVDSDIIIKNPCTNIGIRSDDNQLRKEILSQEEIKKLLSTHYKGENLNIRRAFILSLYCGIRFCDVKSLKFTNIDYSNKLLKFEQNKTAGRSSNSGVVIPLNDDLINLIGQPCNEENKQSLIFVLPSFKTCIRYLSKWVQVAGINKKITWHCARHSFATNILSNGANLKTVASLLGHSTLNHTEKYLRAVDSLKKQAIDSLPKLEF